MHTATRPADSTMPVAPTTVTVPATRSSHAPARSTSDGFCRDRGLEFVPGCALRFRTPDDGVTVIDDSVRGRTEFPNEAIEDFVIARGNGTPVFILANSVDDIQERITQVIRGEEHLSNAPKQQLLWDALGATPPVWGHLPVIVNEKRQKLSKRRDTVALEDYLAKGYLPDAMVNYLMLLGWGPGDNIEIRPYEELEAIFRPEDVTKSSAHFDVKKLAAFNGEYLRNLTDDEFADACWPWLQAPKAPWPPDSFDEAAFRTVAPLAQSRVTVLGEITKFIDWMFLDQPTIDDAAWAKTMKPGAADVLTSTRDRWSTGAWTADALRAGLEAVAAEQGLKLGKAQDPVRVAVTGRTVGLPLFESTEVLGRDRTLARLDAALTTLRGGTGISGLLTVPDCGPASRRGSADPHASRAWHELDPYVGEFELTLSSDGRVAMRRRRAGSRPISVRRTDPALHQPHQPDPSRDLPGRRERLRSASR